MRFPFLGSQFRSEDRWWELPRRVLVFLFRDASVTTVVRRRQARRHATLRNGVYVNEVSVERWTMTGFRNFA